MSRRAVSGAEGAFSFIAENTSDVIVRANPHGVLTYVSPAVRRYGYEPEELVGLAHGSLVHPDDVDNLTRNNAMLFAGRKERGARRQHRFRAADGRWVWFEGNPQIVFDAEGGVVELINIFRDINDRMALEAEARVQAEQFEAAFREAAIGMSLVGLDGRFLRTNEAFRRLVGYDEATLMGLDFQTITHPDHLDADVELLGRLTAGEIPSYRMDKRYIRADGREVWVRLAVSLVRDAQGRPRHYVAQVEDQSERRAAEQALRESEARYRLIAENTSDIITMTALDGQTTYASPSVRQIGWSPEQLEGKSFVVSVHPDDAPAIRRTFRDLLKDGGESTRLRWRGMDPRVGSWTWLESHPSLVRDPDTGAPTGFLDIVRDVSVQVAQEDAVADARAQAEAAAAAKSQFLANMSHEIRTPLTAVLGFTNLLRDMELPEAAAGYVRRIAGAGNALLAIVNDILDFSKLEAGKFEIRPRPTRLEDVCEETLHLFSGQAQAKGLTVTLQAHPDLPELVTLDADRLRQLLINLMGNAIKFTDEGGVTLGVSYHDGDPGTVVLEVADTGPGLDAAGQAMLFQRFSQVDDGVNRRHGGTGLGLAISRGIAEAMGGRIGVSSAPGDGAVFRVSLPAPRADDVEAEAEGAQTITIEGLRLLVVDDNPVNRELGRRILEAGGADVSEACDGAAALAHLSAVPVDVVLMDLRMPVMDGRTALRRLRELEGPNRTTPVVAFTADADVEGDGDLEGFTGLVRKPIQPMEMYAVVAEAARGAEDVEGGLVRRVGRAG